jgi:type I restriction enzyme S subunit
MICNSYQLQDVCSFIDYRGKTPPKTTSGVPLITAKIIKNGTILRPQEYIALDYYDEWMRRGIPKKGSVVFTTEAPLGEVAQIKTGERLAFAQRVIILEPNPNVLSPNYLSYALQDMIIEKTDSNIRSLYVNMCVISQEIGKILPQIPFAMRMESLA